MPSCPKTRTNSRPASAGAFRIDAFTLASPREPRRLRHEHADQPWTLLVVAVAGWIQRDQQTAIIYLLEENRVLNRMIFFGEQSLCRAITEFSSHYHRERNHQGLLNALIEAHERVGSLHGNVRCCKRLGGLLSYYHRDAA